MPVIRCIALALAALAGYLLTGPGGLPVLSAAVLAAMLTALVAAVVASGAQLARAVTAVPLHRRASGLQHRSWRAAFLRQRDPAAAGRPRPRAPSAAPAAA
jgi:hypothetical protein